MALVEELTLRDMLLRLDASSSSSVTTHELKYQGSALKNNNYFVVRNAKFAPSRNTLKLINQFINNSIAPRIPPSPLGC